MKKILFLSAFALAGAAFAEPKISAQSIIVNPVTPDLALNVTVNKDPRGGHVPDYHAGENIVIATSLNRDAYVYLFSIGSSGDVTQILPNHLQGSGNFVKANTVATFPAPGNNFRFTVEGQPGLNKVLALASLRPLDLRQLSAFEHNQDQFAKVNTHGQDGLAQALSIVVTPIAQDSWTTATALFNVTSVTPQRAGNLFVGTNLPGAVVYLNSRPLGGANRTYRDLRPGSYTLRVTAPGNTDFSTTVQINQNETTNVNVEFSAVQPVARPVPSKFPLQVRSALNGAYIFVDGVLIGRINQNQLTTSVLPGSHQLALLAPGYRAWVQDTRVEGPLEMTVSPEQK